LAESLTTLQTWLDPALKAAFAAYCSTAERSPSSVVEMLIRNLMQRTRERLQPDDWPRFLRNEMTREQLRAIHRRATSPRLGLVVIGNNDIPTNGSAA
jgi:hypothetical protein